MGDGLAVSIKNVNKSYDSNKILDNFSMTVEKGIIYGLLGASGCGKTTLLGCIVGLKAFDSGEIRVFGKEPRSKGSGVPGRTIGYMPQDVSLVPEYTVKESIFYFGRIANMKDSAIERRFQELSALLDLPPYNQLTTECSGGQQRRVSLAAAIVHQPKLLILDEPTVGVDSILREKIWNYFLNIVNLQGISVIMTTHYIEECNCATKIGLMRNGKLLAENSPYNILSYYQVETLEQAFLNMCLQDEQGHVSTLTHEEQHITSGTNRGSTSSSAQSLDVGYYRSSEELIRNDPGQPKAFMGISGRTMYALLDKNFKQFYRNIFGLILFCALPISQTAFFLYCVGGDIKDLKLAIINEEQSILECNNYVRNWTVTPNPRTYDCNFTNLTCRFLEYLDNPMIDKVYYNSLTVAIEGVLHGEHVGVLHIGPNFTKSYQERVTDIISVDQSTLEYGEMKVYLDMSSRETGGALKYKLIELFLDFQEDLFSDCMWNRRIGGMPIREEYLFGKKGDTFTIFLIPGVLVSCAFFFAATMTSHIIVSEKCEGVWERSLAAGVTTTEITLGHLTLQIMLSLFQTVVPVCLCVFIYGIEYHGKVGDMIVTVLLQGICGLTFGFWISVESHTHTHAHILINGILYPAMLLSGLMWPIECLPGFLPTVAECLPFTLPICALRNIIRKGWSLWEPKILYYNLVSVAWTMFFIIFSLVRMKKTT